VNPLLLIAGGVALVAMLGGKKKTVARRPVARRPVARKPVNVMPKVIK
jgi:hypothetical protein